jgi:hypothetical protein
MFRARQDGHPTGEESRSLHAERQFTARVRAGVHQHAILHLPGLQLQVEQVKQLTGRSINMQMRSGSPNRPAYRKLITKPTTTAI